MSVKEIYQENLKKGKVSTALEDFRTRWKANNAEKVRQEINDRVTTWLTNNQVYVDNYNYRYQGANNKYRNDASDWLSTITTQKSNFDREADNIRNLLNEYKDYFVKDDWAGKVLIALDSGSRQQSKIVEASTKDLEYWSNWESEDKYNEAIKALEADEAMKKYDLNSAKVELDDLNSQLKNAESMNLQISQLRGKINQDENKLRSYGRYDLNAQKLEQEIAKNKETLKALESQYKAIDTDALKNTISEKSSYYTLSSRKQEAVKLASVVNNPDFEEYSLKGYTLDNPSYDELKKDYYNIFGINNASKLDDKVANKVTFVRNNPMADGAESLRGGTDTALPFYNNMYNQMTEEEVKIYSYYIGKGDKENAEKYLDSLTDTLNQRQAGESFEAIEGNTGMELIFGVAAGLDQFASGIKNLGSAIKGEEDYIAPSVIQNMSGMVREDLEDSGFKVLGNSIGQIGYDAITTTANMLPSMLVSQIPVVGQFAGTALLGASSAGNAYAEMINLGYDKGQARSYATLVGASEAGLQYLLGGISSLGGVAKGGLTKLALSKVDNAFARVAIQLGGSMLSEGIEESLQTILDPWFKSITTNTDFEAPDIDEVLYSGLLGALTAGVLEGGGTASDAIGTNKTGKQLKRTEGSVQRLVNLGQTFSADTVAYQLAGKVNEKTGAYTIGRLFNEVGAEVTAQNQADIQKSLIRKGVAEADAVKISQTFADIVSGVELTKEQAAIVEANPIISKTIVDVIINPNSTVNQRRLGYSQILMDLAGEKAGIKTKASAQPQTATETAETSQADNSSSKIESAEIGRYTASEDGKTRLKDTSEEIELSDVASIKDGELILKTKDGGSVEADNVTFKDKDTALLYESLVDMGVNAAEANLLIHNYELSKVEDGNALSLDDYSKGISEAYQYGKSGFLYESISSKGFAALLDEKQRRDAHTLGREKVWNEVNKKQEETDKKRTDAVAQAKEEGKTLSKKKGNVYFGEKVASDKDVKTEIQKASLEGMKVVAEAFGIDIHLFESYKNEKGRYVYKDKNGVERIAPNGWIESDGSIWIDINAGTDGKGTMLFTLSHELTHFIKAFSPAKYQVYADFLAQRYSENGKNFDDEIADKQRRAKSYGREISYDEALEEVIADASSKMLLDSNAIAELAKQDKTLWEKIKSFIKNIVDRIKKAYENLDPEAKEVKAIRDINGAVEELSALWLDALKDAGEAYSTIAGTVEADVRYSLKGVNENGIEVYETSEEIKKLSAKEKIKAFKDIMANEYRGRTAKFTRNGHNYYATFDGKDISKNIYGDKYSDKKGWTAKINVGAEGDIFELVENSQYDGSARESGKNIAAHKGVGYWDYFIKTVQIDNKVFDLLANVRKKSDGNFVYSIQLNENKKIKASPSLGSPQGVLNRMLNASNDSLSQNSENSQQKFSLRENVEETKDLVAVHNLNEEKLLKSLQLGGLPMPSIAIIRAREGHSNFGNISLVFGKETIDPQFFRSNKVYSEDAWTPTYPQIDYKANEKVAEKVSDLYYDISKKFGYDEARPLYSYTYDLDDVLNRYGGEAGLIKEIKEDTKVMQLYLLNNTGEKVANITKETKTELSKEDVELYDYLISKLGKEVVEEIFAPEDVHPATHRKTYLEKYGSEIEDAYRQFLIETYEYSNEEAQEIMANRKGMFLAQKVLAAARYLRNGAVNVKTEVDSTATREAIKKAIAKTEYNQWVEDLFKGIEEKSGIRNNIDLFTPSGNRRSFEALHYEHNLENVIKAMKEKGSKGIGFSGGSIFGASTKEFSSISDIKSDAETRLQSLSDEEFSEIKKGFTDRFFDLASSLPKNKDSFTAIDSAANMLVEAVVKYKTKSGIASYIRRESQGWADYSDYVVDDLIDLVKDIQQMPTRYFEAKPERAVGFDEVKAVIIPDNSSAELKTALKEKNFNVLEYQSGNKEERTAVLNSIENVRFSERDSDGNELSKEQQEFFKDSAIKVIRENGFSKISSDGKLFPVYHGTNTGEFYKFDKNLAGLSHDKGWFGKGFYFAFTEAEAKFYGKRVLKSYLNIKNPFVFDDEMFSFDGVTQGDVNFDFASFVLNMTEKFPEIAKKLIVDVAPYSDENSSTIEERTFVEIADELLQVYNSKRLEVVAVDPETNPHYEYRFVNDIESLNIPGDLKKIILDENINSASWASYLKKSGRITDEQYDDILDAMEEYGESIFQTIYLYSSFATKEEAEKNRLSSAVQYLKKKYMVFETHIPSYYMQQVSDIFSDELRKRGYDGVLQSLYGDEIVAFEPEQIKLVSNKKPTSNPDIRFSERDSDGNELSKEQQEYFKDSKVRDENGSLVVVYHGTRKADFTVFKRNINYFTDNKEMAESYAPNNEMYTGYLNIANPYIVDAKGGKWSAIAIDAETKNFLDKYGASTFKEGGKWRTTPADIASAIEEAVDEGELDYDGVIIRNVDDTGVYYKSRDKIVANDYIVFNSKQFKNQDNKAPTSDKDIRYSERAFSEQVDAVLGGADTTSTHLKVMDTPALLQEAGLPNLPVLMTAKHLKSITSSSGRDKVNYHGLDVNIVKKLPEYISDPVMIADSITRNDSIVVITEAVDSENRPVLAAILLNGQGRLDSKHINANIMTSAYGKDNLQSFVNRLADSDAVIYWNKKKSQALSVSLRLQLPNAITSLNSDTIIRKAKAFDKQKNSKSLEKFSERDYEQLEQEKKVRRVLEKENQKLKEDNQYLKALVKLQKEVTHGTKMTQTSVDKAAKMLMNDINAKGNRAELVELLNNFYSFIAKGENLAWDSIVVEAKPIVAWLQNHQVTKVEPDPYSQQILSNIRSRRIYLDEKQKAEVASAYGSYNNFRKKTMGRMIISDDSSLSLDSHWQELSSLYPEYFDLETTTNDMPIKMMEIIDVLQDSGSRNMEYEYYEEMMAQDLLMQVYDSYWKVSTLYTVADVKQQEINKLKIKHSQKMQALKEEHKTQDAQLKKDYQERLNKMRLEYRERNAKTQREIMNRYQESRKKAIESRGKTELRHKIRRVVNELNQLLLKGTKDKHVMDDLQKVVAEALEAVNMDTVGAEQRLNGYTDENGVYHKGYNQRIAESSDPDTIKELTATRDRIQLQGDSIKERLKALRDAYEQIQTSDDPEIKNSYHDVILEKIKEVVDLVGDTPLRFMNSNQLESVYDMYKMILTAVRTSNKAFKAAKGETITQLAENVNSEVYRVGGEKERRLKVMSYINKFGWEALKPIYAFRTIGSKTLTRIYNNLRKGEDVFYKDAAEGSDFIKSQYEKHGYKDWDVKATKTFKAKSGKSFDLTLEQMMSIYAYSRREQAHDHLIKGGIVFEDAVVEEKKLGLPVKYEVNTKSAFNLSEETLVEIISSLTDKQKAFVEEMQEYLSTTMGAKGNEVSLEMFGVKLFKEKYYFPLKSSQYYMNFKPEEAGEIKLKSPSFSKATVEHANNPVVLSNFTDVWANHVNDMAMYHSFTLPLEDFARVFNYKTKTDANVETISTEATLASAYGNGVTEYIRTFLRDLNGGVRVPSTPMDAWVSRAKKGAVMASASVVIQQGSAVMRAMAYVDAKHFVATVGKSLNLFNHKKDWTELKTYAPIAGIKEMGYFDVGMGKSTVSWIKSNDTVMDKIDNALSKAPALADEIAWVQIWQAVKRETMHNNPSLSPRSEEFLKLAGERFTEVVSLTQVYDSVFSRSGMMRNKNGLMKMATAFMAEPTVQLNMLVDMGIQGKRMGGMQGVKFGARVTGSVLSSIVVNAMLKSLITAARDDDEDETYAEKYAEAFTGDMVGNLNPLNLIPVVKDIVSIFNGYDVSRMDMNLFSDLKKAIDDFDKENKSQAEKWADLAGAISAFFGVPVKNVKRDIMAAINLVSTLTSDNETTKESLMDAIAEGATGKDKSVSTKLYEAIVSGDEEYRARIEKQLAGKNISTYIRQGLRENDPRIKEAAEAHNRGDVDERVRIAKEIIAEGNFKQDDVVAAINSEAIALNKSKSESEATETPKDEVEKTTSLYSANDVITAFESGDTAFAKEIIDDLVAVKVANGSTEKEAKSSVRSSMTSKLKPLYLVADDNARMEIRYFMRDTGLYGGTSDVINTCRNWLKDK